MNTGLCIGGPKAGKHWTVLSGNSAIFIDSGMNRGPLTEEDLQVHHHVYHWMPFNVGDDRELVGFWVYRDLSPRDVLAVLSQAYEVAGNDLQD